MCVDYGLTFEGHVLREAFSRLCLPVSPVGPEINFKIPFLLSGLSVTAGFKKSVFKEKENH